MPTKTKNKNAKDQDTGTCPVCKKNPLKSKQELKQKQCDKCRRNLEADTKNERVRQQEAKVLADKQDQLKAGAAKQEKQRDVSAARDKEIKKIAASWNRQITAVVSRVEKLRKENPKRKGINAGKNEGFADIPGGSDNPLSFVLPKNDYGITKADVSPTISGFDSSDSGTIKFRRGDKIFVHGN